MADVRQMILTAWEASRANGYGPEHEKASIEIDNLADQDFHISTWLWKCGEDAYDDRYAALTRGVHDLYAEQGIALDSGDPVG